LLALVFLAAGCWTGRSLKFDEERLRDKCEVTPGAEIDEERARCIARLAGLRDKRRCPLEAVETEDGSAWRMRESCSGITIRIDRSDGSVSAVRLGEDAVAEVAPDSRLPPDP
jgi:hypothetical protein